MNSIKPGVKKGNIPWNKGLTKLDPRVAKNMLAMAKTRNSKGYISEELRAKIKKGTNTFEHRKLCSERRAKQVFPFKDTKLEQLMEKSLKDNTIYFKKHVSIKVGNGYHQVDFLVGNLVIECDGNYWHSLPKQLVRDNFVNLELERQGYKVIRFWEDSIINDIAGCINTILNLESVTTIRQAPTK